MSIAFIDLAAQQQCLRGNIDMAIARVLDEGKDLMGPEVAHFERDLAEFCGAHHCLSCANGTDALQLAWRSASARAAVFVPADAPLPRRGEAGPDHRRRSRMM